MKKTILISLCALSLQSCMVVFPMAKGQIDEQRGMTQSHESFMDEFNTKQDIIRQWGSPSSKETIEGIELWYYHLGSTSRAYSAGSVNTNVAPNYNGVNSNSNTSIGTTINSYDKYVEFQFQEDKVVNWRTKGVNYATESNQFGAYMVGLLIDGVLLSALVISAGI